MAPSHSQAAGWTLGALFAEALRHGGEDLAVIDKDTRLTYTALRDRVARTITALDRLGLQPGDGLGLALGGMSADYVTLYVAAHVAGLWTVELPPFQGAQVVAERARQAGVKVLIADDPKGLEDSGAVVLRTVILRTEPADGGAANRRDADATAPRGHLQQRAPGPHGAVLFTSGSTGVAKAVLVPSSGLAAQAISILATLDYPRKPVTVVPVTNLMILQMLLVPTLVRGGTVITLPWYSPKHITAAALTHGANILFLTSSSIYDLAEHENADVLGKQLDLVFYGGEPITADGLRTVSARLGQIFVGAYGQSETLTAAMLRPQDHDPDRPELLSSAGRAMVGMRLEVRIDGRVAEPGEAGEIAISSPGCMLHYLDAPTQTAEVLVDGWVLTGDIGYLDAAGYVHILDRAKFAFTSGGRTVYPHVVEQELGRHEAVQRASVVGVPVGDDHEICAAVVAPGAQLTVDDVRPLFEGRPVPVPQRIVVVDALPLTAADKVDREAVRALFS